MIDKSYEVKEIKVLSGTTEQKEFPFYIKSNYDCDNPVEFEFKINQDGKKCSMDEILVIDCESKIQSSLKMTMCFMKGKKCKFRVAPTIVGGRNVKCAIKFRVLDSSKVFIDNLAGQLKVAAGGKPCNIEDIDSIIVTTRKGRNYEGLKINEIYVTKKLPDLTVNGETVVDMFGQWKDIDSEEKFKTSEEIAEYLKGEYEWAKSHNEYLNPDFDCYGGWKKLNFGAKGHFYKHFDGRRYWLVDPLGNAFFSNGVCYAHRTGIYGKVNNMENWFDYLPPKDDELFGECWTTAKDIPEFVKRNGLEAANGILLYNFARANAIRVFGKDKWFDAWVTINTARMKQWGFNTISVGVNDYKDERTDEYLEKAKIPYCITMQDFPKTSVSLFRDFPDVFSEEYETLSESYAKKLTSKVNDPYFIGYFVTNEPEWLFQRDVNIAERVFLSDIKTASKTALIKWIKAKYQDINLLNEAWSTSFNSFEELYIPFKVDFDNKTVETDFNDMFDLLFQKYSEVPSKHLRQVAPNAINLGMRYASYDASCYAEKQNFDAFSFNCYSRSVGEILKNVENSIKVPYIIGEWHIGAADSKLMSNALVNAINQAERGIACHEYVRNCLISKKCIGSHYFEFNDQPVLGRFDGENMQIGLVDVCLKPYKETICFEEVKDDSVPETHRLFDIRIPSVGDYPTSGYLTFPKDAKEGTLPIYMILTGYGVHSALKFFNKNLVLHLNAHGILNGQSEEYYKEFADSFNGNYGFDKEENRNPDTCYFKNMMLRDIQGLNYLKKHPLWNGKDIILFGGSQGSLQAINIAAHDRDVTKCLLEIPWLCNIYSADKGYVRGWRPESAQGLCYFDEAVAATRVNCDVEIIAGLGDSVSPPVTVAAMFNSLKTPNKKITFVQNMVHQAPPEKTDGYVIENSI